MDEIKKYGPYIFSTDKRLGDDFLSPNEFLGALKGLYDLKKGKWKKH